MLSSLPDSSGRYEATSFGVTLLRGLKDKSQNYKKLLAQVLWWTAGQPILTQALCRLIVESSSSPMPGTEQQWVDGLVRSQLVPQWEILPELKHLTVIRDRLSHSPNALDLLRVYQHLLQRETILASNSAEQQELLRLGLAVKEQGFLKIHNPLYKLIFDRPWLDAVLNDLRSKLEPSDTEFLKTLADLERKLLMSQVDILSESSNESKSGQVLYEVLRDVTAQIGKLLNADRTTIFLLNEEKTELWSLVAQNEAGEFLDIHVRVGDGIAGQVAQTKKVIHIPNNVYDDPRSARVKEYDHKYNYLTQNILAFPILNEANEIVAVIQLLNKLQLVDDEQSNFYYAVSPKGFTLLDLERLAKCVMPIRRILESCQSCYKAAKKLQATAALTEATRSLDTVHLDTKVVLQRVMDAAQKLLNADRTTLWLVDRSQGNLWTELPGKGQIRCNFGVGFVGKVAQTLQPINIPFDLYDHPDAENAKRTDEETRYRTCSLLCMPILSPTGELLGVTQLINKRQPGEHLDYNSDYFPAVPEYFKTSFDKNDLQSMQVFNERVGVILQFMQSHDKLKDLAEIDAKDAVLKTLAVLSHAVLEGEENSFVMTLSSLLNFLNASISYKLTVERATFFLLNRENQDFWSLVPGKKGGSPTEIILPGNRGIVAKLVSANYRKAIHKLSHLNDPLLKVGLPKDRRTLIRNFLIFPIWDESGNIVAVLRLLNKLRSSEWADVYLGEEIDPQGFTQEDVAWLNQRISPLLPILQALQTFYQESRILRQQRQAIDPLDRAILDLNQSNRTPEEIIKNVMKAVKVLTNADRTSLWLVDRQTQQLWTKLPQADNSWQEVRVSIGEGFVGQVAQSGQALNIPFDLYNHPNSEMAKKVDRESGYRTCSLLCMPVFSREGEILGVTQLINKRQANADLANLPPDREGISEVFKASFNEKDCQDMEIFNQQVGLLLLGIL